MHVVATAGHVDHGKSTLVRALTGMEPDRWAEERRRGMTIDLGFAWTRLPTGEQVAFVDVPGHERFVPNMLAGVGPVPAVLLVVAADEGWMPQTAEHAAALDALGVREGVLAVTRSDLADPAAATASALARLRGTALAGLVPVAVSGATGAGLPELRNALHELVGRLPPPDADAPVRLWVDRSFTVRGSGTVVTGTLPAGTLRVGDELVVHAADQPARTARVRGLQALGAAADVVPAVARVAVNLRGIDRHEIGRGDALVSGAAAASGRWRATDVVDARLDTRAAAEAEAGGGTPDPPGDLAMAGAAARAGSLVLHLGSASVAVRVRPLGEGIVRLTLARTLPLAAGDAGLLRDPGAHRIAGRVTVLDTAPQPLRRRGAAAARARELRVAGDRRPEGGELLRQRGLLRAAELRGLGASEPRSAVRAGEWLLDPAYADGLRPGIEAAVAAHRAAAPLEPGPTVESVRAGLRLPDVEIVAALVGAPLAVRNGRVVDLTAPPPLPPRVAEAVAAVRDDLAADPYAAPEASRLAALGLGPRELAVAERAGALLRVADGIVLLPGADETAARVLAGLPQPFTLSQARQALGTSRRIAVPLLELLDRRRLTRRLPDDRRVVVAR